MHQREVINARKNHPLEVRKFSLKGLRVGETREPYENLDGRCNGFSQSNWKPKLRTMAWAVKLRVNTKVVRVQEMRRKWGSCSSAGTITLAIDLVHQDEKFQDYVIVHELLHLKYATHGRVFKGAHECTYTWVARPGTQKRFSNRGYPR